MLVKFSVKNYKQFKDEISFDLSAGNYEFNSECVKDGVVKTALIYGQNGTGKTNIGSALFNLVTHLTDSSSVGFPRKYLSNALADEDIIEFEYVFQILESEIIYKYKKNNDNKINAEYLTIDGKKVIDYEFGKPFKIFLDGTEYLNKDMNPLQNLSVLKYVMNNTNLDTSIHINQIFSSFMIFVQNMVWFQTVSKGMNFLGSVDTERVLTKIIISGYLLEFETFLNENGVKCKLVPMEYNGYLTIAFKFGNNSIPFVEIASTGTKYLSTFYFWWIEIKKRNISLLFIDEFDASYHHELSFAIVEKLKQLPNTQVILTTHNTSLLDNDLIRPDCSFIIDGKQIKSLNHCTERELRMAHNLEKMYRAGGFNV